MAPEDGEVFILTTVVNGCELSFGVFRSVWISDMLNVCFGLSLWTEFAFCFCFLWVLLVSAMICACVPWLRYPRKGKNLGYIIFYSNLVIYEFSQKLSTLDLGRYRDYEFCQLYDRVILPLSIQAVKQSKLQKTTKL